MKHYGGIQQLTADFTTHALTKSLSNYSHRSLENMPDNSIGECYVLTRIVLSEISLEQLLWTAQLPLTDSLTDKRLSVFLNPHISLTPLMILQDG